MNRITIGRSNANDIILPDPSVSRRHAELRSDGRGRYFLIDLDSTNGTYVRDGGEWVRIRQGFVAADERVQFGELVTTLGTLLGDGAEPPDRTPEEPGEPEALVERGEAGARQEPKRPEERDDVIDETPPPSLMLDDERREPAFRSYQDYLAEQDAAGGAAMRQATVDLQRGRPRRALWLVAGAALVAVLAAAAVGGYYWLEVQRATVAEAEPAAAPPTSGATWQQTFGGADIERAHGLAVLAGGELAVAGSTRREESTESAAPWLLAVAPDGAERWSTMPPDTLGRAQTLTALADGGLIAAGAVRNPPESTFDGWAARLDADGAVAWARDYGTAGEDTVFNAAVAVDDGAVLAGITREDGDGDGWLVKIDGAGEVSWETSVGGPGGQALYALAPVAGGGFLAAGINSHESAGGEDGWLVRLDDAGEVLWQTTVGGAGADYLVAVQPLPDGGAVAAGRSDSGEGSSLDLWVVWFDAEGAVTLERRLGGERGDGAAALALAADGGLLVAGFTDADEARREDGWLLKLDASNGRTLWERRFGGAGADRLTAVATLEDGSIAVAGQTASGEAASDDLWLMRLDADGRF